MRLRLPGTVRFTWIAVLIFAAWPVAAQEPARFRPQPGTLWVELSQLDLVYAASSGDTALIQAGGEGYVLQEWSWLPGDMPRVRVRIQHLLPGGGIDYVTFTIDPRGALRAVNGRTVTPTPSNQIFPILPVDGRLEPGRTWTDSLSERRIEAGDTFRSSSNLAYRVSRVVDTLGTRVAVIEADGRELQGVGLWSTSLDRPAHTRDMAGASRHIWWFDLRSGRLIELRQEQDLRGAITFRRRAGGMTPAVDTMSGTRRVVTFWREISSERADLLRRLGATVQAGSSQLAKTRTGVGHHRARVVGDTVESMFVQKDGVITARTVFSNGRVVTHAWQQVTGLSGARGGVLGSPGHTRDDAVPLPPPSATTWAVAIPGMEEHLVPVLRTLPTDSTRRRFAIYHPAEARWTNGSVQIIPLGDKSQPLTFALTGVVFREDDGRTTRLLAFDRNGEIIMASTMEGKRWRTRSLLDHAVLARLVETDLTEFSRR